MGSLGPEIFLSAPTEIISAEGILLDFDGTIIDSTDAIVKHWHILGKKIGVDPEAILATSHGRRSIDVLKLYDPAKANWEYISQMEGRLPVEFGDDATEIPGARKLLAKMEQNSVPFAIVTSGTRALVEGWLKVLKLTHPEALVVAEDVENGKPDPSCYLLGRDRLGLSKDSRMIVVEDAPSGIRAGKAAGFRVIGLATTHTIHQIQEAGADWIVQDLRSVTIETFEHGVVQMAVSNALVRD